MRLSARRRLRGGGVHVRQISTVTTSLTGQLIRTENAGGSLDEV